MARLVPNPLGDVLHPLTRMEHSLTRVEGAISGLHEETAALRILPEIAQSLARIEVQLSQLTTLMLEQQQRLIESQGQV